MSSLNRFVVLAIVLFTVGTSALSAAQQTAAINGFISDQTGASVAGARVELVSGLAVTRSVTTDNEGRYRVDGLQPGDYTVRVTARGFQSTERRVNVAAGSAVADFRLDIQALEENILVRGDGTLTVPNTAQATAAIERTPGAVDVIPDTAFKNGPASTIKDVLGWVPGVMTQTRWGPDARVSIRGSGLSRSYGNRGLNFYMDGIPINTADGLFDLFEVDPTAYRYVEVYKGANALRYGANSLGGAVMFVTPTGRDASTVDARFDVGSFGQVKLQASAGGASGRFDYFVTGSSEQSDGYREHSNGDMQRLTGNVGIQLSPRAETRFYVNANTWDGRLPGEVSKASALNSPKAANPVWIAQDQQRNIDSVRVANKTTLRFGAPTTLDFGVFGVYRHVDHPIFQYIDYTVDDLGGFTRITHDGRIGGRRNRLVGGLNVHNGENDEERYVNVGNATKGALVSSVLDRSTNASAYVEDAFHVRSNVALIAGTQFLHATRTRTDRFLSNGDQSGSNVFDLWTPKGGILWDVDSSLQVFGNISRSAEVPTFDVATFTTPATSNLEAQTATTFEIGTRGGRPDITWELALYRANVRNELQCLTSPSTPGACTVRNADRTVHQGVEAGVGFALLKSTFADTDRFWVNATYTYNGFFFDDDPVYGDNQLPGVPPHYIRAELLYNGPHGFYVGPNVEWMPQEFFADNANSLAVDPYGLLNLRAGIDLGTRWVGYVEARNLFDTAYISTAAIAETATPTAERFNPGYGRSIYTGIRFKW